MGLTLRRRFAVTRQSSGPVQKFRFAGHRVDPPVTDEVMETITMHWPTSTKPFGVHDEQAALTMAGWRPVRDLPVDTPMAHPKGQASRLLSVTSLGERDQVLITLADRTAIQVDADQPLQVLMGAGRTAKPYLFDGYYLQDALVRGRPLRLPRHSPYLFGTSASLPLDAFLVGALLGDGYLRRNSLQWCNQQKDMHALVGAALPPGTTLTPLKVGAAGTGSATIVSTSGRSNAVTQALLALGLTGSRAWEKFIPRLYLEAAYEDRLALLTGLMETDGSIDSMGRMEFGSSSEQLSHDVRELIHGLGGRATLTRRDNITFTSPRQATPKAARPCYRLTNIRLPDEVCPFRRPQRIAKMKTRTAARQWRVTGVTYAGTAQTLAVTVSAQDGLWIGGGCFPLLSSPAVQPDRQAA